MKPSGDICPECMNLFEPNTDRSECMSTSLCRRCCVESTHHCVDACGQALADIADDNAADYAYDLAYA